MSGIKIDQKVSFILYSGRHCPYCNEVPFDGNWIVSAGKRKVTRIKTDSGNSVMNPCKQYLLSDDFYDDYDVFLTKKDAQAECDKRNKKLKEKSS